MASMLFIDRSPATHCIFRTSLRTIVRTMALNEQTIPMAADLAMSTSTIIPAHHRQPSSTNPILDNTPTVSDPPPGIAEWYSARGNRGRAGQPCGMSTNVDQSRSGKTPEPLHRGLSTNTIIPIPRPSEIPTNPNHAPAERRPRSTSTIILAWRDADFPTNPNHAQAERRPRSTSTIILARRDANFPTNPNHAPAERRPLSTSTIIPAALPSWFPTHPNQPGAPTQPSPNPSQPARPTPAAPGLSLAPRPQGPRLP